MKTQNTQAQGNTGILLIDMQEDFLAGVQRGLRRDLIDSQRKVLEYAGENKVPVFGFEYKGCGNTAFSLRREIQDNPKGVIMSKNDDSCFVRTPLEEILKKKGINQLFLMGIYASACVKATANHALIGGFNISTSLDVIEDRLIDNETERTEDSLNFYSQNGILYKTADEFLASLGGNENDR